MRSSFRNGSNRLQDSIVTPSQTPFDRLRERLRAALWLVARLFLSLSKEGSGCAKSATLTLTPIGTQTALLGSTLTLALSANGSGSQTFEVVPLPLRDKASFNAMSGVFTFSPAPEQVGESELTFSVTDGSQSDSETVRIRVPKASPSGAVSPTG